MICSFWKAASSWNKDSVGSCLPEYTQYVWEQKLPKGQNLACNYCCLFRNLQHYWNLWCAGIKSCHSDPSWFHFFSIQLEKKKICTKILQISLKFCEGVVWGNGGYWSHCQDHKRFFCCCCTSVVLVMKWIIFQSPLNCLLLLK